MATCSIGMSAIICRAFFSLYRIHLPRNARSPTSCQRERSTDLNSSTSKATTKGNHNRMFVVTAIVCPFSSQPTPPDPGWMPQLGAERMIASSSCRKAGSISSTLIFIVISPRKGFPRKISGVCRGEVNHGLTPFGKWSLKGVQATPAPLPASSL